jgi:hypothetical protein
MLRFAENIYATTFRTDCVLKQQGHPLLRTPLVIA